MNSPTPAERIVWWTVCPCVTCSARLYGHAEGVEPANGLRTLRAGAIRVRCHSRRHRRHPRLVGGYRCMIIYASKNRTPNLRERPVRVRIVITIIIRVLCARATPARPASADDCSREGNERVRVAATGHRGVPGRRLQRVLSTTKMALQYIMANAKLYTLQRLHRQSRHTIAPPPLPDPHLDSTYTQHVCIG